MANPYSALPDPSFWRRAVAGISADAIDPVTSVPFQLSRTDNVAAVGSCFAQHISRTLGDYGIPPFVTEAGPRSAGAVDLGYGIYPARFGNIYTTAQLLQLFERAYGIFSPRDLCWRRSDGRHIDPIRPEVQPDGFSSPDEVAA